MQIKSDIIDQDMMSVTWAHVVLNPASSLAESFKFNTQAAWHEKIRMSQ